MPKLGFHPKAHGWHFTNTFVNHVLPGTPFHFETSGLCGGMVMSALDYWRSGNAIPTHTAGDFGADGVPADGSTLRTYIFDRQMNSLLTGMTVTRWVVMPWFGSESFHEWAVGSEFEVVQRQIERERPTMLGLWAMPDDGGHQVLCYGYDSTPVQLWVYDPNYPDTEMLLVPVSPDVGCEMRVAATGERMAVYRGYFWMDVYNWNEPPYQPPYHDLEVASGLTLAPSGDNVPVAGRLNAAATVRNAGEYPARFKNLFVWTRGPDGSNLDHLLGGAEPDLTVLHPGEERLLSRQAERFGEQAGDYVVGISYLSNQDDWLAVTARPGATTTQQQVTLRSMTEMIVDRTVEVRESDSDVDTRIDVAPGMEYALTASGSIWAGVWFTGLNGPAGWTDRIETNPRSPLTNSPQAHPFSLVGRFDGSTYFYVGDGLGRRPYEDSPSRRLFLRINDDTPGNGTGSFRCRIQAWR